MQSDRQTDIQPPYIQGLNPQQQQAVEAVDGAVLVLAGAGTGKTRVLTTRLAHILHTRRAAPGEILAVTFTNKAAQEMKERVAHMLGGPDGQARPIENWWLGTFHALAARMLRRHADLIGLTSQFTIIDTDDQLRLIKALMEDLKIDVKKSPPKAALSIIDRLKDRAIGPHDVAADDVSGFADDKMVTLYKNYQNRLKTINACDFGDLLMHVIHILRDPNNGMILAEYHHRFKYLMVDEYQDTNTAQYLWLKLLAQGTGNICCVGDDDQSIYGWRGAELGNILRFEKDFPNAQVIRLEQNYRSTNRILKTAGGLIASNENRLGKELWSQAGEGDKILVRGLWDGGAEARWIGEKVDNLSSNGAGLNSIAVLVRAGFQMREFEERFIQLGIPYKVYGGLRFYERAEIRDALAYFRVVVQSRDDLALERIINVPKRGIGNTTLNTLHSYARSRDISLYQAITDLLETDELKPNIRNKLAELISGFEGWRADIKHMDHPELAARILDESGYTQMWQNAKTADAPGRVENLKELISAMSEFESLGDFLEHVSLVLDSQNDADRQHVTLMTLHGAKGLEFDHVFLPGWEEGLFPSQRTMDENGLQGLEEERRLAYVGITRARKNAFISYAANRRMYGSWISALPSRFVDELPEDHIDFSSDIHSYGAGGTQDDSYTSNQGRSAHWDSSGIQPHRQSDGQSRGNRHNLIQNRDNLPNTRLQSLAGNLNGFKPGVRVRHQKFGLGSVIHVDGHKLDIKFDTGAQKRVMDSFVDIVQT